MSALDFSCAVTHDTAAHLRAEASIYASGDAFDDLAREIAADAYELADLCADNGALRVAVCKIAMTSMADRFGLLVEAIKEHAADQLDSIIESERDAADADEAEARAA